MESAHVSVRNGTRLDVTEALPEALREEFGNVLESAEEDKAETKRHEIRPYLPSIRLTLSEDIDKDAFEDFLTGLGEKQNCTYELRSGEN